jgi:hypothetical protein
MFTSEFFLHIYQYVQLLCTYTKYDSSSTMFYVFTKCSKSPHRLYIETLLQRNRQHFPLHVLHCLLVCFHFSSLFTAERAHMLDFWTFLVAVYHSASRVAVPW